MCSCSQFHLSETRFVSDPLFQMSFPRPASSVSASSSKSTPCPKHHRSTVAIHTTHPLLTPRFYPPDEPRSLANIFGQITVYYRRTISFISSPQAAEVGFTSGNPRFFPKLCRSVFFGIPGSAPRPSKLATSPSVMTREPYHSPVMIIGCLPPTPAAASPRFNFN